MDPGQERERIAEIERARYLSRLRNQAERRDHARELREQAIAERADYEARTSRQFLEKVSRRTEFRAHVKSSWLDNHKAQEQLLQKLGQLYRERLTGHLGRFLESASLRLAVGAKVSELGEEP